MSVVQVVIALLLIAVSFTLPVIAIRIAPSRTGPVPGTDHLTAAQQRGIRRRFVGHSRLWVICIGGFVLATGITLLIYLLPVKPGLILLATMLGVPFVAAVAAVMYLVHPLWHHVVTEELKRLGELRVCPRCGYDRSGSTRDVCPECGTRWDESSLAPNSGQRSESPRV